MPKKVHFDRVKLLNRLVKLENILWDRVTNLQGRYSNDLVKAQVVWERYLRVRNIREKLSHKIAT